MAKVNYHSKAAKQRAENRDYLRKDVGSYDPHDIGNRYRDNVNFSQSMGYGAELGDSRQDYGARYKVNLRPNAGYRKFKKAQGIQKRRSALKDYSDRLKSANPSQNNRKVNQTPGYYNGQTELPQKKKKKQNNKGVPETTGKERANHKYLYKVRTKNGTWRYIYDTTSNTIKKASDSVGKGIDQVGKNLNQVGKGVKDFADRAHSTGLRYLAKLKF